jgi:hypothetical protein
MLENAMTLATVINNNFIGPDSMMKTQIFLASGNLALLIPI